MFGHACWRRNLGTHLSEPVCLSASLSPPPFRALKGISKGGRGGSASVHSSIWCSRSFLGSCEGCGVHSLALLPPGAHSPSPSASHLWFLTLCGPVVPPPPHTHTQTHTHAHTSTFQCQGAVLLVALPNICGCGWVRRAHVCACGCYCVCMCVCVYVFVNMYVHVFMCGFVSLCV